VKRKNCSVCFATISETGIVNNKNFGYQRAKPKEKVLKCYQSALALLLLPQPVAAPQQLWKNPQNNIAPISEGLIRGSTGFTSNFFCFEVKIFL
jgi:hypothetical protein